MTKTKTAAIVATACLFAFPAAAVAHDQTVSGNTYCDRGWGALYTSPWTGTQWFDAYNGTEYVNSYPAPNNPTVTINDLMRRYIHVRNDGNGWQVSYTADRLCDRWLT